MLRQVRLINFQAIDDLTYNFTEGLNVIVSPNNNVGKSIINKMVEVLVKFKSLTSKDMLQYISFGKPKSDVFITDDNNTFWIEIYPNRINYNILKDGKFEFIGNELPSGVIDALGLLICEGGFIGNLITADHSKLLVDSDSNINNQILSLIARNENAEDILAGCEERISVMRSNVRTLRITRYSLENELSTIHVEDTTAKEESLKRVFNLHEFVESLIGVNELCDRIDNNFSTVRNLRGVIEFCNCLEDLDYKLSHLNDFKPIRDLSKELKIADELVKVYDNVESLDYKISLLKPSSNITFNENLIGLVNRLEIIYSNIEKVRPVKNVNIKDLDSCKELENLLDKIEESTAIVSKLSDLKSQAKDLKEEIDSYGGEVYDCPIYGSIKFVNEECIRNYN